MISRTLGLFSRGFSRRWRGRRVFRRQGDWFVSLYDTFLRYATRLPLPLRRRPWPLSLATLSRPVFVRLGGVDTCVLEEIYSEGVYNPVLRLPPDSVQTVLDCGANIGLSVRLWLEHFPKARVIAVEPSSLNLPMLKMNIAAGKGGGRVSIVKACVAARPGRVFLDNTNSELAFEMSHTPVASGEPVEAKSVPDLLQGAGIYGDLDLLKCDIEGAEVEVFNDCSAWIGRVRNLFAELHGAYTIPRLLEDLRRGGGDFRVDWTGDTAGNPLVFLRRA
jgi:FkbM family methyltransferase